MAKEVAKHNDTLGDLYALRAGLSVISQQTDELKQAQNEEETIKSDAINNRTWFIDEYGREVTNLGDWVSVNRERVEGLNALLERDDYQALDKKIQKMYDKFEDLITAPDQEKKEAELEKNIAKEEAKRNKIIEETFGEWLKTKDAEEYIVKSFDEKSGEIEGDCNTSKKGKRFAIISAVLLCLGIGTSALGIVLSVVPILAGGAVLAVLSLMGMIYNIRNAFAYKVSDDDTKKIEKYDNKLNDIYECREILAQCDEKYMPIIKNAKQNANVIYKALQKSFNKLIDERDWKHLDLIIYYFETGRADNMKEALQLVERETQTKRIIGAIEEAKQCICEAVESMANRISAQLGVISNQLTQIANLQQIQIAQNSELISQTKMQNALIAKSNVTSEQLMKDVKFIKTYGVEIR